MTAPVRRQEGPCAFGIRTICCLELAWDRHRFLTNGAMMVAMVYAGVQISRLIKGLITTINQLIVGLINLITMELLYLSMLTLLTVCR